MIVECNHCETRFQLDDSRIPERGIRVRCSRCKQAFFLEHPSASQSDALNDIAENAATEMGAPPDSTQDLSPETALSASEPGIGVGDSDEEDWEFNDDSPDEDHDESEPPESDDGLFRSDSPADADAEGEIDHAASGLDLRGEPSGLDLAGDDGDTVSESDCDFGEVIGDLSGGAEEPEPLARSEAPVAAPVGAEDVGEPEEWDFFSDESLELPGGTDDAAMGRVMATIGDEGDQDTTRIAAPVGPRMPKVGSRSGADQAKDGLRQAGRAVGWIVTLSLLALGLVRGVLQVPASGAQRSQQVDFGDFRAEKVRGVWVETARAGTLYAVRGRLVNETREARWPGAKLQATLLGALGERLDHPPAIAGIPLMNAALRELPPAALSGAAMQAADQLAWSRLEAGGAVEFLALFTAVPDEAAGFILEMDAAQSGAPVVAVEQPLLGVYGAASPTAAPGVPGAEVRLR